MLARLDQAGDEADGDVTLEQIVAAVGRRSFGPLLLLAGLVVFSPLSGIPGLPTLMALVILLVAGQLVARRRYFWLPRWILNRRISRRRLSDAVRMLRRPAGAVDRVLRPRLRPVTRHIGLGLIVALSIALALAMPMLELVPFTSSVAGAAIAGFGVALIAQDGLAALLAMAFLAIAGGLVAVSIF